MLNIKIPVTSYRELHHFNVALSSAQFNTISLNDELDLETIYGLVNDSAVKATNKEVIIKATLRYVPANQLRVPRGSVYHSASMQYILDRIEREKRTPDNILKEDGEEVFHKRMALNPMPVVVSQTPICITSYFQLYNVVAASGKDIPIYSIITADELWSYICKEHISRECREALVTLLLDSMKDVELLNFEMEKNPNVVQALKDSRINTISMDLMEIEALEMKYKNIYYRKDRIGSIIESL
jgi:hypothetical protein